SERAPDRLIPPALEEACMAALIKDPLERTQDVRVLWRAVENYIVGQHEREKADAHAFEEVARGHRFGNAYLRLREARALLERHLAAATEVTARRSLERELRELEVEVA